MGWVTCGLHALRPQRPHHQYPYQPHPQPPSDPPPLQAALQVAGGTPDSPFWNAFSITVFHLWNSFRILVKSRLSFSPTDSSPSIKELMSWLKALIFCQQGEHKGRWRYFKQTWGRWEVSWRQKAGESLLAPFQG